MAPDAWLATSALAVEPLGQVEQVSNEAVRQPVAIPSDGEILRGWLYLPGTETGTQLHFDFITIIRCEEIGADQEYDEVGQLQVLMMSPP